MIMSYGVSRFPFQQGTPATFGKLFQERRAAGVHGPRIALSAMGGRARAITRIPWEEGGTPEECGNRLHKIIICHARRRCTGDHHHIPPGGVLGWSGGRAGTHEISDCRA